MELRIFTEPQQGATYEQQLAVARLAEELDFNAFFRSDHYLAFAGDGLPGPTDSWVTLGGLARETSTIRLGTLVTSVTFRWPGVLAISVAQVDAMSNGRVELGLGTGWNEVEHRAYGIPFGRGFGERFERLEETLQIVRGLWTTPVGERFSFAGQHVELTDAPALPKPVQQPHPPIIIGGGGPRRTPRLAARYADEYNTPFLSPADFGAARDRVRAACEAAGRDPDELVYSAAMTVCCGADEAEVERRAGRIGRSAADARRDIVGGTPAEVVERLHQYGAAGATRFYLQVLDLDDLDHLHLLATEVMPHV